MWKMSITRTTDAHLAKEMNRLPVLRPTVTGCGVAENHRQSVLSYTLNQIATYHVVWRNRPDERGRIHKEISLLLKFVRSFRNDWRKQDAEWWLIRRDKTPFQMFNEYLDQRTRNN